VLISKVGDHSIDLPEANVVIQVGVVDGSRMQGSLVGCSQQTSSPPKLGTRARRTHHTLRTHARTHTEAQRLGRVQRKKPGADVSAYFYTIVSEGTDEVGYSDRYRATPSCRLALEGGGGESTTHQLLNSFGRVVQAT
jgi:hypothetical protein